MTWQERLRQLDARLAGGEIGANDYRKARDEILAEASSGSSPQQQQDLWTPAAQAATAEQQQDTSAETTIVVEMPKEEDEEQTQIVPADSFVTLQPPPAPPGPGLPPGPPSPGQLRPPPPLQGQEVFADASGPKSGGLARLLVPLLILVLVGAGVWWFAFRDSGGSTPASTTPSSTAQEKKAPGVDEVAGLLPELPGKASANNGAMAVDRARELKLFTPAYASLLSDHGADQVVYRGATRPGFAYLLAASPIPPDDGADELATATNGHLTDAGFAAADGVAPAGPTVITRTDQVFRTYIAVYSSGDVWVQFNVSGPPTADDNALRAEFETVLGAVTERLPAD